MENVISDCFGNQLLLKPSEIEKVVTKAIHLKCPEKLKRLLSNHRAFLYYPDPKLITKIFVYNNNKGNV